MKTIRHIKVLDSYNILVCFDNNEEKICDLAPFLENGDFRELKEQSMFNTIRSIKWGIEWANGLDLSADTLEAIGGPAEQSAEMCSG